MQLDRLPRRITGFFEPPEGPRTINGRAFTGACHLVAQMDGGSVAEIELDLRGRNYYAAALQLPAGPVTVLCNSVFPYLAFTPSAPSAASLPERNFIEPASARASFAALTDFCPLDADWLATGLSSGLLVDLARAELAQVAYWKPQCVGGVIFNDWD